MDATLNLESHTLGSAAAAGEVGSGLLNGLSGCATHLYVQAGDCECA